MGPPTEPAVDLPLWRLLKAAATRLRQLAGKPPPLPESCYPNIIPFPTGRHHPRPSHNAPRSPQRGHVGGSRRSRPAGLEGESAGVNTTTRAAPQERVEG